MDPELFEEWEKNSIILNKLDDTLFDREMEEDNEIATDFLRCNFVIGIALSATVCITGVIYNYLI